MNRIKKGMKFTKECVKSFIKEEDGVGIVEVILILVILIGLVVIFKDQIQGIVQNAMSSISKDSGKITGNN